jgi:hypothetical protein
MPSTVGLHGVLVGLSHVFYNAGDKAFFAKVRSDDDETRIVAFQVHNKRHRKYLLDEKNLQLIGRIVSISNLCRTVILGTVDVWVAQSGTEMVLDEPPAGLQSPLTDMTDIFEGVVTDDSDSDCGVYRLNRKVILVATAVCRVTNFRRLKRGQGRHSANYS